MTSKVTAKRGSSPASTSLGRAQYRASPKTRVKRSFSKMNVSKDMKTRVDVDNETIPLSEKDSNINIPSAETSKNNTEKRPQSGCSSTIVIPNAVEISTEVSKYEHNNGGCIGNPAETVVKQHTVISNSDTDSVIDKSPSISNGLGKFAALAKGNIDKKEKVPNEHSTPNHLEHSADASTTDKEGISVITVPILEQPKSLTVPGTSETSVLVNDGRQRKDSVLSFAREGSRLSSESFRSMDIKYQYTSVQMAAQQDDRVKTSAFAQEDSWIRVAIPYLPVWLAVTCLIMNIFIPGSGTILSGLSIYCCAKSRVPAKYDQDAILITCVNMWVGVAQLFTVSFMLVGWFWGIAWGIKMVILAVEWRRERRQQRAKHLQTFALSAFGSTLPGRLAALT